MELPHPPKVHGVSAASPHAGADNGLAGFDNNDEMAFDEIDARIL